ncbi:hypothetical protein D9M73_231790 [compost metagenome]
MLVLDRRLGFLLLHLLGEAAALDHEARNHAVENRVVVEAAVHVFEEVLGTDRGLDRVQFDFDLAVGGVQQHMRCLFRRRGHQVGGKQDGACGEGDFFQHGSVILSGGVDCGQKFQQRLVEVFRLVQRRGVA